MFNNDKINCLYDKISQFEQLSNEHKRLKDKFCFIIAASVVFIFPLSLLAVCATTPGTIMFFSAFAFSILNLIIALLCIHNIVKQDIHFFLNFAKKCTRKNDFDAAKQSLELSFADPKNQKELIIFFENLNWDVSNLKMQFALKKYDEASKILSSYFLHLVMSQNLEEEKQKQDIIIADYEKSLNTVTKKKPQLRLVGQ